MKNTGFLIVICFVMSCHNRAKQTLVGKINGVSIERSLNTEICNPVKIIFELEIKNNLGDSVSAKQLIYKAEPCRLIDIQEKLTLVMDSSFTLPAVWNDFPQKLKYGMIVFDFPNDSEMIPPHSTIKFKCILLSIIYGASLNDIYKIYGSFLHSSFRIESKTKNFTFKKGKQFQITYKLNGERVDVQDSIRMNATPPKPPFMKEE